MLLPHSSAVEITDTQSSGRFGWNYIYLDQVNVIKTETYLYDLILILCGSVCCNLYIVFCFGGALRVMGQVDVIKGETCTSERIAR